MRVANTKDITLHRLLTFTDNWVLKLAVGQVDMENTLNLSLFLVVFNDWQRVYLVLKILVRNQSSKPFVRDSFKNVPKGELGRSMVLQHLLTLLLRWLTLMEKLRNSHSPEIAKVLQEHKDMVANDFIEARLLFMLRHTTIIFPVGLDYFWVQRGRQALAFFVVLSCVLCYFLDCLLDSLLSILTIHLFLPLS